MGIQNAEIKRWAAIGGIMGGALFVMIYGAGVLNPFHYQWVFKEPDMAQTFFGWIFYRQNQNWATYLYGIEGLSYPYTLSIVFMSMEIPLALPLKPLLNLFIDTNVPFQICGIWGMMNYVLQGAAAGLLMVRISKDNLMRGGGILVLLLSPYLMQRSFYHQTLASQYVILFAFVIWLYRDGLGEKEYFLWPLLFTYGTITHIYFAPILGLVMLAAVTDRAFHEKSVMPYCAVPASIACGGAAVGLLGGLSSTITDADEAWGESVFCQYSSNLNTFFNSEGHSLFLNALPEFETEYEGFGYLGAGILLLLCIDAVLVARNRKRFEDMLTKYKLSFCCVAGLAIVSFCIAVGPRITLGSHEILFVPVPEKMHFIFRIFRSIGRFVWIPSYLLMLGALVVFSQYKCLVKTSVYYMTLICIVGIQVIDLYPYAVECRKKIAVDGSYEQLMVDERWEELAAENETVYATDTKLTRYPTLESFHMYMWIFENRMKISSTRIAHGGDFLTAKAEEVLEAVYAGSVEDDVLYWFADADAMDRASSYLHCEEIDGYLVGWKE